MIQRIQTLFLLGVIICMAAAIYFPIWEKTYSDSNVKFELNAYYWQEYDLKNSGQEVMEASVTKPTFYLAGIGAIVCIVSLFSIFQYKKRTLQVKLGALNAFLMMIYIALATYFIYQGESRFGMETKGIFKPGYFLPLGALVLNSLANRFIRKDEKLVRSSYDRIR